MRDRLRLLAAMVIASACCPSAAIAAPAYVTGKITNLTTTIQGIMITIDAGVPTDCVNSPGGWMLIPTTYGAIASLTLSIWLRGDAHATVYVSPTTDSYCAVNQVDPVEQ